jgi:hypothetical protein
MNKNSRKAFIIPLLAVSAAMVLAACGGKTSPSSSSSATATSSEAPASSSSSSSGPVAPTVYDGADVNQDGYDFSTSIKGVTGGQTGVNSFVSADVATRTNILGSLEKYAVDNAIAGLPLYENGGYVMYNPRVQKGVANYITGYGFGILREGSLSTVTLTGDIGKIEPTYYHNWDQSDPGTINALNDKGSQVSDLFGNMSTGYFGTKAGANGSSYDWYGTLSNKDRPYIVDEKTGVASKATDSNATSKVWRIYLRTGQNGGVTYRTGSTKSDRLAFDGTYATIDDYLDTFHIMLTKKFGFYRGSELAAKTGKSGFAGLADYYNASADGMDSEKAKAAWAKVGITKGTDTTDGDYLQFQFLAPTNRFYAMYNLSDSLYTPIPLAFWNLVTNNGADSGNYGGYNKDKTTGPVDNILSTGAYYLKSWEDQKSITFARNDSWKEYNWDTKAEYTGIYKIPGIYTTILPGYKDDNTVAIKQFLADNLDAAGIPQDPDYIKNYKNDTRAVAVPGDSVFKLNVNSTTQDQWNALFGAHGSVSQGTDNAYKVKPWMSNPDFIKGLFYSLDRKTYAGTRGVIPSINYFSSNYMSDPEGGVSYNTTDAHKNALTDFWGTSVNNYGFDKSSSQTFFASAITAMLADGTVKKGDKLSINIWWMDADQVTQSGEEIAGYMQDAFNTTQLAVDNNLTLTVDNEAVTVWSDVYYKHLMVGQFDLGFGSITGNALDPLNFMEVLKSNNSSGFTLNWGPDTSALDLTYNGATWSFDNLWAAADHGVVTYKGQEVKSASVRNVSTSFDADNNAIVIVQAQDAKSYFASIADKDADAKALSELDDTKYGISIDDFFVTDGSSFNAVIGPDKNGNIVSDTEGVDVISFDSNGVLVLKISQDVLGALGDAAGGFYVGMDVTTTVEGVDTSTYDSITYELTSSTAAA